MKHVEFAAATGYKSSLTLAAGAYVAARHLEKHTQCRAAC